MLRDETLLGFYRSREGKSFVLLTIVPLDEMDHMNACPGSS